MQPITFPFDSTVGHEKGEESSRKPRQTARKGSIKPGEFQEIMFTHGGTLNHDNPNAFKYPLPEGYFGMGTVIFASAASYKPQTIKLTFHDDNGNIDQFDLDVVP